MIYPDIANKIIELRDADLKLRDELIQKGELGDDYNPEMKILHNRNAQIIDNIIEDIGYPTIEKVGKEANAAAWLIIQHAIAQPEFMRKCAKLLENTLSTEDSKRIDLAYLSDRIAVFEGRLQLYGTQFDWDDNGMLSPQPYDDIGKVNQRRLSIGLNTIEEQTITIRSRAKEENQTPPGDLEKRKTEYDLWRKDVGWIE